VLRRPTVGWVFSSAMAGMVNGTRPWNPPAPWPKAVAVVMEPLLGLAGRARSRGYGQVTAPLWGDPPRGRRSLRMNPANLGLFSCTRAAIWRSGPGRQDRARFQAGQLRAHAAMPPPTPG
jgi:hypothetical protein